MSKGGFYISIKEGLIVLILISCIGIVIFPAVAATSGTTYNLHPVKLPAYQVNKSPTDYSFLLMPFGFTPSQPYIVCDNNGLCYDENATVCGSCTTDPIFPIPKSPLLAWAQVPYQPSVLDPNTPLIHGTQFDLTRDEFLRRHPPSAFVELV